MSSQTCQAQASEGVMPNHTTPPISHAPPTSTGSPFAPPTLSSSNPTPTPPLHADPSSMQQFPNMPPFFANPFMAPFMPQQVADPSQQTAVTPGANPANPMGFFFSPAQYQEMMQQYFQQMMAAAPYANMNAPFPMPNMQMAGVMRPDSQTESLAGSQKGDDDVRNTSLSHEPQSTSSSPEKSTSISVSDTGSVVGSCESQPTAEGTSEAVPASGESSSTEKEDHLLDASVHEKKSSVEDEPDLLGDGDEKDVIPSTNHVGSSPPESVKSEGGNEEPSTASGVRKTSLPEGGESEKDCRTASLIKKQMSEIEKEITRRSQNKNVKKMDDLELAELIGAVALSTSAGTLDPNASSDQHQEPTFAPHQQSALPFGNTDAPPVTVGQPKQTLNQLRNSFNLPETGPVVPPVATSSQPTSSTFGATVPQSTVATSSFAPTLLSNSSTATASVPAQPPQTQQQHPIYPQQTMMQTVPTQMFGAPNAAYPFQIQGMPGMPFYQNPFSPSSYPAAGNGQAQFSQEQFAAAAMAQAQAAQQAASFGYPVGLSPLPGQMAPQQQQTMPTSASAVVNGVAANAVAPTPVTNGGAGAGSGSGLGLVPPPPQTANPVQKRHSGPHAADQHHQGHDANDPVWVMRDSYLKRMQREQDAAAHAQASTSDWPEGASTTNGETVGDEEDETDRLLLGGVSSRAGEREREKKASPQQKTSKETLVHEPAVLIEGVLFRARYLGSTQMVAESCGSKAARMSQAQEAVARVKAPEGEVQPSTDIDLFISTEKIMVLNTDLQRISDTDVRQDILMDHALRTISYIADIGDLVVLMARRMSPSNSDENCDSAEGVRKSPKVICHVFESDEASFIAQSIGQAFQVAYVEFLRANGIDDPSYLRQIDYQEVLNSQELLGDELEMFAKKETQKDVVVPKKAGEALGVVVVESGWGSMLPTVVLAHMAPTGPAARSNQLNIGDQIIAVNGISLVGLPLSAAQKNIQNLKTATAVRLTVVNTPPVVEVRIRRPDTKYQLGFSVQNGVICSLLRGGIAERGGIRVGHRIIEINHHSVVAVAHDRIVNMLATAVGEIHMKTMPTSMFRLLTGQEVPNYI